MLLSSTVLPAVNSMWPLRQGVALRPLGLGLCGRLALAYAAAWPWLNCAATWRAAHVEAACLLSARVESRLPRPLAQRRIPSRRRHKGRLVSRPAPLRMPQSPMREPRNRIAGGRKPSAP